MCGPLPWARALPGDLAWPRLVLRGERDATLRMLRLVCTPARHAPPGLCVRWPLRRGPLRRLRGGGGQLPAGFRQRGDSRLAGQRAQQGMLHGGGGRDEARAQQGLQLGRREGALRASRGGGQG